MPAPVPFAEFLAATAAATPDQYADALLEGARAAGVSPEDARAGFGAMKDFVLNHYREVTPVGSSVDANGVTVDYVPFEQQESVRRLRAAGLAVAESAPPPPPRAGKPRPAAAAVPPPPSATPAGTVTQPRLTLDQIAPYGTLDHYLRTWPAPPTGRRPHAAPGS